MGEREYSSARQCADNHNKVESLLSWQGRKQVRGWVALLLPCLLLRSLIPLGFMPMFGPGYGVRFVLCESYAPVPGTAASMSMDMNMDPAMHRMGGAPDHLRQNDAPPVEGGTPDHQDHGNCPYGAGPVLGGLPTPTLVSASVEPAAALVLTVPQVTYFKISPRAQSSRGPPA
jgi:hypothetical protein